MSQMCWIAGTIDTAKVLLSSLDLHSYVGFKAHVEGVLRKSEKPWEHGSSSISSCEMLWDLRRGEQEVLQG